MHIIAYFYHWDEDKILALSVKRREWYVEAIRAQVARENADEDEADYALSDSKEQEDDEDYDENYDA